MTSNPELPEECLKWKVMLSPLAENALFVSVIMKKTMESWLADIYFVSNVWSIGGNFILPVLSAGKKFAIS